MKYSIIVLAGLVGAPAINAMGQDKLESPATGPTATSMSAASPGSAIGPQERNLRYRLRKGDIFDLDLAYSPEFNRVAAVQADGCVTLKGVGSLFVEERTVPELTATLKTAYAKTLHDPVVAIDLS